VSKRQQSTQRQSIESARAALVKRELNRLASQARRVQRQVEQGIVTLAAVIGILQSFYDTGYVLLNALPVLVRGLVRLPAFFGAARPAVGA
jgi:hypothetical protein